MSRLFLEHTPVEPHRINGVEVWVKRDDLYGQHPAPALGKLRGLRVALADAQRKGIGLVGCWDTRISMLGLGLAACCQEMKDMRCLVSFPVKKSDCGAAPPAAIRAAELGAELFPVAASRINICLAQVRRYVERQGGFMLPFGLECEAAVEAVAKEAALIHPRHLTGTIVVTCGSGVTLAGILRSLKAKPKRVIGISSGRSRENILRCLRRYLPKVPNQLEIIEAKIPYHTELSYPCPFPANANYDLKAWKHLVENLSEFQKPIFFWNVGS